MTDHELLELLRRKPEEGGSALLSQYTGLVYTIVRSKLGGVCSEEDLEELVSDIFYLFFQNLEKLDLNRGSIKALLSIVAKRRAINRFHAQTNRAAHLTSLDDTLLEVLAESEQSEDLLEHRMQREELLNALDALGEPDRTIMVCKYYLGETATQIANRVGLKQKTVEKRAERALKKLRLRMGGVRLG